MSLANIAGIQLALVDGPDLSDKINPRTTSLTLSEKRGEEADTLSLTLQNADGSLEIPATGRQITLAIGWQQSSSGVLPGLIEKGRFTVDEAGASGPPDAITIRARSADLTRIYSQRRTRSWTNTTLGTVLGWIASGNGGFARVESALAIAPITAIEQEGKSDMAFVRDLGRRYDAIATWKDGVLLFLPIGGGATASGQPLGDVTLTRQDGWTWNFSRTEREARDGASAQWHDAAAGRRRTVTVGGENRRRLSRIYATEAEARQAAQASVSRDSRAGFKFTYDLAVADCTLQPDMSVNLQGWGPAIDGVHWLIESVETTLGAGGLRQKLELEGTVR